MNIGQFWMKFFSKETKVKGLAGTANYYVVSSWRFHIEKLMIQNNTKNMYIYIERDREREKERERKRNCYYLFRMENLQILFCNWIWSVSFAFFLLSLFLQIIFLFCILSKKDDHNLLKKAKKKEKRRQRTIWK